jgi:hypothetical protein
MTTKDGWNYFDADRAYADVLASRLLESVEMDSARAMAQIVQDRMHGDLSIVDFGSGPGHYLPVLRKIYTGGSIRYHGVDIIEASVATGNGYFANEPAVTFTHGSVLEPADCYAGEETVISANTLPHVPSIEPLMRFIAETGEVRRFLFRMLIGRECVQIRKHLSEHVFDDMFDRGYQHNNIYSPAYLRHLLGEAWTIEILEDQVDFKRLATHSIPAQQTDAFYGNRVSRAEGDKVFKGEIYMPWKFVLGSRTA